MFAMADEPLLSERVPPLLQPAQSCSVALTERPIMPRDPISLPPGIKVFRTQIGVHDYVVATSSQQAALEAWDISRNLFASGEAARTDEPSAVKAALGNLGKAVAVPHRPLAVSHQPSKVAKRSRKTSAKR